MDNFKGVKPGLAMAIATIVFGVVLAVFCGLAGGAVKEFIRSGIAGNSAMHGAESFARIWELWQRAYLYAVGIGTLSLVLICTAALSSLRRPYKLLVSVLIGLTGLYAVALFLEALLAPSMGMGGASNAVSLQFMSFVALISFLIAVAMLMLNIFIGNWSTCNEKTCGL